MAAHPEVLVQLRDKLVADAEGFNDRRRQHKSIRNRLGCEGPPESTGHGMQEEICLRTREAPKAPECRGSAGVRYTAIEARKGKPGYRAMPEPNHMHVTMPRQAEKYCEREKPPHAFGESYQAYYSERGKATYKGKVLTEVRSLQRKLAPDTVGPENYKPTSLQGIANKSRINKRYRYT